MTTRTRVPTGMLGNWARALVAFDSVTAAHAAVAAATLNSVLISTRESVR